MHGRGVLRIAVDGIPHLVCFLDGLVNIPVPVLEALQDVEGEQRVAVRRANYDKLVVFTVDALSWDLIVITAP